MRSDRPPVRIAHQRPGAPAGADELVSADMSDVHLLPLGVSARRRSEASLYRQIYDGLRSAILDGRLESGVRLPSTRAAAAELGVARNTMVAVFEQLAAEGARAGLALAPLSGYWMGSGGRAGLHLGYAGISEEALEEAVRRLAGVLRGAYSNPRGWADAPATTEPAARNVRESRGSRRAAR